MARKIMKNHEKFRSVIPEELSIKNFSLSFIKLTFSADLQKFDMHMTAENGCLTETESCNPLNTGWWVTVFFSSSV